MKKRDTRRRIMEILGGIKNHVIVPRCNCTKCGKLHVCLPEQLVPYKHYAASVIEDFVDLKYMPEDPEVQDYPCEGTVENWNRWIDINESQIDGHLKAIYSKLPEFGLELLESGRSLLEQIRKKSGWLKQICTIIYQTNGTLLCQSFAKNHTPDFVCVISDLDLPSSQKEEKSYDSRRESEVARRRSTESLPNDHSTAGRKAGSG